MTTLTQRMGLVAAIGSAMGWGEFGGGIDWRHHGRHKVNAYRAKRRHKNRIASRSRARNRK